MRISGWVLLGWLAGCSASAAEPPLPAEIHVVSEAWEGHSEANGRGLAWDLLRQVFEPVGVTLRLSSMPYTRSVGLVKRGAADAWVGSYLNEVKVGVVYPRWHYDTDQISALGLASQAAPSLASLGEYRLVWMRGYQYQLYLPNLIHYREIERRSGILSMLAQGHADLYLDARTEIDQLAGDVLQGSVYRVTDLLRLPLYFGFSASATGRSLAQLYDRRMDILIKNGSLRPIFTRWQQPYPFDK
ncbi:MAG: ABC transporter substrate-binding protein [Pseudomonas sp.]|uniref:ABC transporter substrate-binding protein n=1 Tax=Pseudomonas sp. TaxID=306 RepID=UPI00339B329E